MFQRALVNRLNNSPAASHPNAAKCSINVSTFKCYKQALVLILAAVSKTKRKEVGAKVKIQEGSRSIKKVGGVSPSRHRPD